MTTDREERDAALDRAAADLPTIFWLYHLSRVVFGAGWLFSGLMHFFWPQFQPMGSTPEAHDFTVALMDSGLFDVVKGLEILVGVALLANRAMPLALLVLIALNIVITYWNFLLDDGLLALSTGTLTVVFTLVLIWPWRRYFWRLFVWRGRADFSAEPGIQDIRI